MAQENTQGLLVEFDSPRLIATIPATDVHENHIRVLRMVDYPIEKKVIALCSGLAGEIVLWEGEAYDSIGDWTNQNVIDRINELFPPII